MSITNKELREHVKECRLSEVGDLYRVLHAPKAAKARTA